MVQSMNFWYCPKNCAGVNSLKRSDFNYIRYLCDVVDRYYNKLFIRLVKYSIDNRSIRIMIFRTRSTRRNLLFPGSDLHNTIMYTI